MKKISRQRAWQIKMVKAGRCRVCGKPRDGYYADVCDAHAKSEQDRVKRLTAKRRLAKIGK